MPPRVGDTYDVEVDIDAESEPGVRLRAGGDSGFKFDGDRVVLGGLLRVYPDGAVYLEVDGLVVSAELPDDLRLPVGSGQPVELSTGWTAIRLYPYHG